MSSRFVLGTATLCTCLLTLLTVQATTYPECTFESCPVCLPDAKTSTSNLTIVAFEQSYSLPLRIGRCLDYWDSQAIYAQIIGIIAKEVIGINVEYLHFPDEHQSFLSMHNCVAWQNSQCDLVVRSARNASIAHNESLKLYSDPAPDIMFAPEIGAGTVFSPEYNRDTNIQWLATEAREFGTAGYVVQIFVYVPRAIVDHAFDSDGVSLDSYIAYTRPQTLGYFDSVQDLIDGDYNIGASSTSAYPIEDPSCDVTQGHYARNKQELIAYNWTCVEGWWLAPACAAFGSEWKQKCIPLIDDSWDFPKPDIYKFIANLGMNFAKATLGYDAYWEYNYYEYHNVPFLWWIYDAQFTSLDPAKVNMPQAYLNTQGTLQLNYGWTPVLDSNEQLEYLLTHVRIGTHQMTNFMSQCAAAQDLDYWPDEETGPQMYQKLACDFLRENREPGDGGESWEQKWLPAAEKCSVGKFYNLSTKLCQPCAAGTYSKRDLFSGIPECLPCPPGHFCVQESGTPEKCHVGYFSANPGADACISCLAGSYQNKTGQTACIQCGEYKSTLPDSIRTEESDCACDTMSYGVDQDCFPCPRNSSTSSMASSSKAACLCVKDTYMSADLATCLLCPDGSETDGFGKTSMSECSCEAGTFRPRGGDICIPCKEGMVCGFGSDANNFLAYGGSGKNIPALRAGYYSTPEEPLSIYSCETKKACPGGDPGACKSTRTDLVCAGCLTDYAPNRKTGVCDKCKVGVVMLLIFSPLVAIFIIVVAYYLGNSPLTTNATVSLTCTAAGGLFITSAQLLGTFHHLSIQWPSSVGTLLGAFTLFTLSTDTLSIECALGNDAVSSYIFQICAPLILIALTFITFAGTHVLAMFSKVEAWDIDKVCSTAGQVLQVLFIAFAIVIAEPFSCFPHPNGTESVRLYPQILCWTSAHFPFLGLAALELICFLIPFASICIWATLRAPKLALVLNPDVAVVLSAPGAQGSAFTRYSMGDATSTTRFLKRFRFLMFRFRPDVWWWGIVFVARQVFLAFASSLPADDPQSQITFVVVVLVFYVVAQVGIWPWKNHSLNCLDATITVLLLFILCDSSAFVDKTSKGSEHATLVMILIVMLGMILLVFVVVSVYKACLKGIDGEFHGQTQTLAYDDAAESITNKWVQTASMLTILGLENCESMVKLMNQFDRECISRSLTIWETTCSEYIPAAFMSKFGLRRGFQSNRLRSMKHSTSYVDHDRMLHSIGAAIDKYRIDEARLAMTLESGLTSVGTSSAVGGLSNAVGGLHGSFGSFKLSDRGLSWLEQQLVKVNTGELGGAQGCATDDKQRCGTTSGDLRDSFNLSSQALGTVMEQHIVEVNTGELGGTMITQECSTDDKQRCEATSEATAPSAVVVDGDRRILII